MSQFFEFAPTADRSTLEQYAKCPLSARLTELHCGSAGVPAAIGQEVHEAIAIGIREYINASEDDEDNRIHWMNPPELAAIIQENVRHARPDVQIEAMESLGSAWAVAEWIVQSAPWDIMRHDGGEGERSGQMTMDVETSLGVVQFTSEIDFLAATPCKEIVRAGDFKTGWKLWAEGDVYKSFQMRGLSLLIFENYPDCQEVEFSVFNTRTRRPTYPVRFKRMDRDQIYAQIQEAAEVWMKYRPAHNEDGSVVAESLDGVPAWPARGKCEMCDAAAYCTAADGDIVGTAKDPNTWLQILHAAEHRVTKIRELLSAVVHNTGRDVRAPGGLCFGLDKPKPNRKPTCDVYEAK